MTSVQKTYREHSVNASDTHFERRGRFATSCMYNRIKFKKNKLRKYEFAYLAEESQHRLIRRK